MIPRIVIGVIILCLATGCAATTNNISKSTITTKEVPYAGYIAINPISLPPTLLLKNPTASPSKVSDFRLINNAARVSSEEINAKGEVKFITSNISTEGNFYRTTIDYIKYITTPITIPIKKNSSTTDVVIVIDIGVGLRAETKFTALKSGANIADIINMGVAAQNNQISGTMAFQTMGIESKTISDTLPIPSELSKTSIQNALQTMATIKANIYDTNTIAIPQIVGIEIQTYPDDILIKDILSAIYENKNKIINDIQNDVNTKSFVIVK